MDSNSSSRGLNRRSFLCVAAGALVQLTHRRNASGLTQRAPSPTEMNLFVATGGDDRNPGTEAQPLKTLEAAQRAVRTLKKSRPGPISVYLRSGVYYLAKTIVFTSQDAGAQEASIRYAPYPGEHVTLSGGGALKLSWTPYRDGIFKAQVPAGTTTDQLFVNGQRQVLARYPNYDPTAKYLNGFAEDAISPERVKRWANPAGGYIHALHQYLWGDMHFVITGKDSHGNLTYEGGWQNNRPKPMHSQYRFVENIFEELDAPGEWFLDAVKNTLYFYPPAGLDLATALVETVRLKHLVEFRGTQSSPVQWISLSGFTLRHTTRTFMETREPLLRSDWRIYRGGAVLFEGAEHCTVEDCFFDQLGGNCVFVNHYNRDLLVARCHLAGAGAGGVCFVGDRAAVRNPLDSYEDRLDISQLDRTAGPLTDNYPSQCVVEDSLIYQTGRVEKQSAPIEISMSQSITVRHTSIYDVPRAGINIGDGCWGGHHIDFCDVFDTVKETGDHGSFNSWARDRWWGVKGVDLDTVVDGPDRSLPVLDAVLPITLSNTRWRCDHGWDIDLDDGSTNYHIYNNLCLNGGLKLREGFYRTCENNILVNNTLHPHVWYNDSRDVFRSNIVFAPYRPIGMREWTQELDFNLLHQAGLQQPTPATALQLLSSHDMHSLKADAQFVDPPSGDYRVKSDSPAHSLGFNNFSMQSFGVQAPQLKAIAKQPELPHSITGNDAATVSEGRSRQTAEWAGATVRNIVGLDEVSAAGTPGETGVILLAVPPGSNAEKAGLLAGDVVLKLQGKPVTELQDLLNESKRIGAGKTVSVTILRFQQESTMTVLLP
jgi:hypothetical protein